MGLIRVGALHRLGSSPGSTRLLGAAVEDFLAELTNPNTARAYGNVLRALAGELGADMPVASLDDEATVTRVATWFASRWGGRICRDSERSPGRAALGIGVVAGSGVDQRRSSAADPPPRADAGPDTGFE